MASPNSTYISPREPHTHTVILLHGRGSTGLQFSRFFESQAASDLTLPETFPTFKWVFPSSPLCTSDRFQTELSQWFDIWSVQDPEEHKELQIPGLKESIPLILDVIYNEAASVPLENIILGGISQGCATGIHALLSGGVRLGAFVGLCSWLPFQEEIGAIANNKNGSLEEIRGLFKSPASEAAILALRGRALGRSGSALTTPVFLSHSMDDYVVPIRHGERLCQGLKELGMGVMWKVYEEGGHWVNQPQGLDDIVAFLQRIMEERG